METKTFKVGGLHCKGCALSLEDSLEKIAWIEEAKVDFDLASATIRYEENKFNYNKIKDTIERKGFKIID